MAFGKCRQVWQVLAKQVGECRWVWGVLAKPLDECWCKQDRLFYTQITYFICIKRSSLHLLNLPNLPNSPNLLNSRKLAFCESGESSQNGLANVGESGVSEQNRLANVGASGESGTFPKKTVLANLSTCQKWWNFGEHSNLLNSRASGHSLNLTQCMCCAINITFAHT